MIVSQDGGVVMRLSEAIASGNTLAVARAYIAAGVSVIPVKCDGSKAPRFSGWRQYSDRLPTDTELLEWFSTNEVGIGVVPGPASGNLTVLDFEFKAGASAYVEWFGRLVPDLQQALLRCPTVRTPSGGRHVWVRLPDVQPGGKLARYSNGTTKVEVRGHGHQVLAPGCPLKCHSSGNPYVFENMGWLSC